MTARETRWALSFGVFFNLSTTPIKCSDLIVALDYVDSHSSRNPELRLLKISATKQPADGAIIINFGGPGTPGRMDMATTGVMFFK